MRGPVLMLPRVLHSHAAGSVTASCTKRRSSRRGTSWRVHANSSRGSVSRASMWSAFSDPDAPSEVLSQVGDVLATGFSLSLDRMLDVMFRFAVTMLDAIAVSCAE